MKRMIFSRVLAAVMAVAMTGAAFQTARAEEETEPARTSRLAAVAVPAGAQRLLPHSVPENLKNTLASLIEAGGDTVRQGEIETLVWSGQGYKKSRAVPLMTEFLAELQRSGWTVKTEDSSADFRVLTATRNEPKRRALVGVWIPADEALVLGWTEMLSAEEADAATPTDILPKKPADVKEPREAAQVEAAAADAIILTVDEKTNTLNVMKNAMPKIPPFPELELKPGFVRGYVKDVNGQPLKGAALGVRSTAIGGAYSGAQGKSDAKGYYEIAVPSGAAHFYNAGYAVDYGEGRAALGLHPADGELDSFASDVGGVENFVLLSYGIADRDNVQENPRYCNNYYGGDVIFSWHVSEDNSQLAEGELPNHSVIEITLTPRDKLLDGSPGKTIVIRKTVGTYFGLLGQLYTNNIPVTTYRMSVKLVGGGALKMKEVGPNGGQMFGINPKEATGTVNFQLRPSSAKADAATPAHGNWEHISVDLTR